MRLDSRLLRTGAVMHGAQQFYGHQPGAAPHFGRDSVDRFDQAAASFAYCRRPPQKRCLHNPKLWENAMSTAKTIQDLTSQDYKWGFVTTLEEDKIAKGLNEDVIRVISAKKGEPEFMLEWRLKAYRHWASLEKAQAEPKWANVKYGAINYQDIVYYSAPKQKPNLKNLNVIDPEILRTYEKLGIPLEEQKRLAGVAVDAVFDSVSVATTFKEKLAEKGVIFCSFLEGVLNYAELVRKYLGTVVPYSDNFFAALNAAVFTDGSFVYVPKGVRCPMELSTYFRINAAATGQFERTLIVADEGSY